MFYTGYVGTSFQIIEKGEGELVVKGRPGENEDMKFPAVDYIPCQFCCGFIRKNDYKKHLILSCCTKPSGQMKFDVTFPINSKIMLAPFVKASRVARREIYDEILLGMRTTEKTPDIRNMCKNDLLLKEFGLAHLDDEYPNEDEKRKKKELVKSQCRLVGVVLKRLNESQIEKLDLSSFISGEYFEEVVKNLEALSEECKSPSVAEKLGLYFHQICLLKLSMAIEAGDDKLIGEAADFKRMQETYWNPCGMDTTGDGVENLTIDIVSLKIILQEKIDEAMKNKRPTPEIWMSVAERVLAQICLINKADNTSLVEAEIANFLDPTSLEDIDFLNVPMKVLSSRLVF